MESLSILLSSSPPFQDHTKIRRPKSTFTPVCFLRNSIHFPKTQETQPPTAEKIPSIPVQSHVPLPKLPPLSHRLLKPYLGVLLLGLSHPLSSLAVEATVPPEQTSDKISIDSILVSIDDFFNRYPFFVAGVLSIWLIVIPLTQAYFRKYRFVSAINAFRKLRDDPDAQLLDIRDRKSVKYLCSPNLKILKKDAAQVHFSGDDEGGFLKKVLENFGDPANTTVCILDNFDGNSMKVAELLFKNGFKQAYAIRGGVRGKNGWQEIQEALLPPAVHVYRKKKVKRSQKLQMNDEINKGNEVDNEAQSTPTGTLGENEKLEVEVQAKN